MSGDKWADWLLSRRDGGDPEVRRSHVPALIRFRDGVLDRAAVAAGDVVLDVGAGDGLIGFGALERVGPNGRVIFSDISADLLAECRRRAGDDARCAFLRAAADDLVGVADGSVDVLTTRSVLIYVGRKEAAFAEFRRVLRPGGRLSIFEPINRFMVAHDAATLFGYDLTAVAGLVAKVRGADRDRLGEPMIDFDERDLLGWARAAGFTAIEMDYRVELGVPAPAPVADWDALIRTAPNPLAPTYEEAMAATLTAGERAELEGHVRALVAAGAPTRTNGASVFLRAVRA